MTTLRGLYAVTPDWNDSKRLLTATEAIPAGGCRIVQYRNKATSDCHRQEQAGALRILTRRFGALLIVNDSVDRALQVEADGVHLGGDDGDLRDARAQAILVCCGPSISSIRGAALNSAHTPRGGYVRQ